MKVKFIGDSVPNPSNPPETKVVSRDGKQEFTLKLNKSTEVPAWVAERVQKNGHFEVEAPPVAPPVAGTSHHVGSVGTPPKEPTEDDA